MALEIPVSPVTLRLAEHASRFANDEKTRVSVIGIVPEDSTKKNCLVSVAVRDKGVVEMLVPKEKYDAFAMIDLIEKHFPSDIPTPA